MHVLVHTYGLIVMGKYVTRFFFRPRSLSAQKVRAQYLLHNEFAYTFFFHYYYFVCEYFFFVVAMGEPRSKNHLKCNILIKIVILSRSSRNCYKPNENVLLRSFSGAPSFVAKGFSIVFDNSIKGCRGQASKANGF